MKDLVESAGAGAQAGSAGFGVLAVGFLAAFLSGCAACKWMIQIVRKGKLIWFGAYCAVVGLLTILFL